MGNRIDMLDVGYDDMLALGKRVVYISGVRPDKIEGSRRVLWYTPDVRHSDIHLLKKRIRFGA